MIKELKYVVSDGTVPYRNQAVEALLMQTVQPEVCVLYLWQNRQTVVIGRNQSSRAECRTDLLEEDGGFLARRLSGGGAVFHDLGNLNFSFLAADPDYSVERQQRVILSAVRSFGLNAEITGRNDLTVDGRKFSGNAFMSSGIRHCHHGTLLLGADTSAMQKYLSVSREKLESKGVSSVRSRVVNLSELTAEAAPEAMSAALVSAFAAEYGLTPQEIAVSELDSGRLSVLTRKFSSPEWRLEKEPDFIFRKKGRFSWGGVELCLRVSGKTVAEARLYTDSLDPELPGIIENALSGAEFSGSSMQRALKAVRCTPERGEMIRDLSSFLEEVLK